MSNRIIEQKKKIVAHFQECNDWEQIIRKFLFEEKGSFEVLLAIEEVNAVAINSNKQLFDLTQISEDFIKEYELDQLLTEGTEQRYFYYFREQLEAGVKYSKLKGTNLTEYKGILQQEQINTILIRSLINAFRVTDGAALTKVTSRVSLRHISEEIDIPYSELILAVKSEINRNRTS